MKLIWNGYLIERVTAGHIDALISISESAFGIQPGKEYYVNKNSTAEWGDSYLGYIAFDEITMQPAAFYGVYACVVECDGVEYKVVQSGDTMTHRSHGGKGLFTKLAELTYELCRSLGYHFVFGFPNYNSYPGFVKKLNWICPGKLNEYRFRIVTFPLVKLAKKFSVLSPLIKYWVKLINCFFKTDCTAFDSSAKSDGVGYVKRLRGFVEYKKLVGGSFFVQIDGVDVWLKTDGFLVLGDIKLNHKDNFNIEKFVKGLKFYAFLIGADTIITQCVPDSNLDVLLGKLYSPSEGFPYGFCRFRDEVNPEKFKYVMADVDTF